MVLVVDEALAAGPFAVRPDLVGVAFEPFDPPILCRE
jgi:hypothetical protein